MRTKELTPKQELFCQVYVSTGNATEAYRQAYDTSSMKYSTVMEAACRLTKNSKISARVKELEDERLERLNPKHAKDVILEFCMSTLQASPKDLYTVDVETGKPKLKPVIAMDKANAKALKEISYSRNGISYKFESKAQAAEIAAKILGLNAPTEVNNHTDGGGFTVTIKQ